MKKKLVRPHSTGCWRMSEGGEDRKLEKEKVKFRGIKRDTGGSKSWKGSALEAEGGTPG